MTEQNQWDFDALDGSAVSAEEALAQPGSVNAQIQQAMHAALGDAPEPPEAHDDLVTLPGGLYWDGELVTTAQVREMTGEDEEALARVKGSPARWVSVLLERCVVRIGDVTPTAPMVRKLLVGDRDALLLGVRIATLGKDITAHQVQCPHCEEFFTATVDLTTVTSVRLEDPQPRHEYSVALRGGRSAVVRLPDGEAQEDMLQEDDATLPERNTALLARCLVRAVDAAGETVGSLKGAALAKSLGLADRKAIIRHIAETQPGPKLDDIKFAHEGCGKEVILPITIGELFRGE